MAIALDHLMWGAPSLEAGMATAIRLFGVEPARGGSHAGLGTCNALLALGDVYLEIIAPDPAQQATSAFASGLAALAEPSLIAWAAASGDLPGVAAAAREAGLGVHGPVPTQRITPQGETLNWELLYLHGHSHQGLMPFFIDWLDCTHPASVNPQGGSFAGLRLRSPDARNLERQLAQVGIDLVVEQSAEPQLAADITTADGAVELTSTAASLALLFG